MEEQAKTVVEFESKMYILYEMRDELSKAIESIDAVLTQQDDLIKLIKKNATKKEHEKWNDFIKGLTDSNENYTAQRVLLSNKITYLTAVLDVFEKRADNKDIEISKMIDIMITYTIIALGI